MNSLKIYNRNRWNLAFFEDNAYEEVLNGNYRKIHWMKYNERDRWFADPFILSVTDKHIVLLVEEFSYRINRGRIAKLIVDKSSFHLLDMKIILDLDTHLSFPMIYRKNNEVFVLPENSASGKSTLYKFDFSNEKLIPVSVICNEPLTDAIFHKVGDQLYIFATKQPNPNGKTLSVYKVDKNTWRISKTDMIDFDRNVARNAGSIFIHDGEIFRPAQDCDGSYGKGVVIQKITFSPNNRKFIFTDNSALYPFNFKYQLGLHTLNCHDGMFVIDGRGLLYPILGRMVRPIISLIK